MSVHSEAAAEVAKMALRVAKAERDGQVELHVDLETMRLLTAMAQVALQVKITSSDDPPPNDWTRGLDMQNARGLVAERKAAGQRYGRWLNARVEALIAEVDRLRDGVEPCWVSGCKGVASEVDPSDPDKLTLCVSCAEAMKEGA